MKKFSILLAILCLASGFSMQTANAFTINIDVGDHAYYTHGPGYWVGRVYYVWVPGHWEKHHGRRVWVHGYYVAR